MQPKRFNSRTLAVAKVLTENTVVGQSYDMHALLRLCFARQVDAQDSTVLGAINGPMSGQWERGGTPRHATYQRLSAVPAPSLDALVHRATPESLQEALDRAEEQAKRLFGLLFDAEQRLARLAQPEVGP